MDCGNPAAEAAKGPAKFERGTWYLMGDTPFQNSLKFSALCAYLAWYAPGFAPAMPGHGRPLLPFTRRPEVQFDPTLNV